MLNFPIRTSSTPAISLPPTPHQPSPQELRIRAFIGPTWDDSLTAHDNLVVMFRQCTNVAEKGALTLRDFEFHLQPLEQIIIPANIKLIDCRLAAGTVKYHAGNLTVTNDQARAIYCGVNSLSHQPTQLKAKIDSFLSKEDSRKLAVVNKDYFSGLSLRPTLKLSRWCLDYQGFVRADHLIRLGHYKLPVARSPATSFASKANFFSHLTSNRKDLYTHLRTHPELVNDRDEQGMTLLHHAASTGLELNPNGTAVILQLLFNAPGIDFNIRDSNGDTPVHLAARIATQAVTAVHVFPNYIRKAAELGFDFSAKGEGGLTVLHWAARHICITPISGRRISNVMPLLQIMTQSQIPNLNGVLDALDGSGSTALFYCVQRFLLNEARALLLAGADPQLSGSPERSPLAQLKTCTEHLSAHVSQELSKGRLPIKVVEYGRLQTLIEFEDYMETFIKQGKKKQSEK